MTRDAQFCLFYLRLDTLFCSVFFCSTCNVVAPFFFQRLMDLQLVGKTVVVLTKKCAYFFWAVHSGILGLG